MAALLEKLLDTMPEKLAVENHNNLSRDGEQTAQGRLLKGYLHKTSNSLCGIKGYASLIADEDTVRRSPGYWARKIISEVERMEEIFRSVGDLTGTRRIPDLEVNLESVVIEVARQTQRTFPHLEIFTGPVPQGDILLPAVDLALVIQEIIKNSSEAAEDLDTRVRVEIRGEIMPTGRVALSIVDNGPGISSTLMRRVKDPFCTTKSGHHGIGLTRVETLLEMYGLAWSLHSEEGHGTVVTFETAALKDQSHPNV